MTNKYPLDILPPGSYKQPQVGNIRIVVKKIFMNIVGQHMFSFTLWGRKNNDVIMMERIVDNVDCYGKYFSINSSMDMLSKYFYDMGLLQIQVHSLNVLEYGNNGKKRIKNGEEIVKQHRFIGVCNCNLRRYFVNNQFCYFEDMFPVVAGNNKLVGEIVLGIRWTNEENLNKIGALVEVYKEKRETRADNASNKYRYNWNKEHYWNNNNLYDIPSPIQYYSSDRQSSISVEYHLTRVLMKTYQYQPVYRKPSAYSYLYYYLKSKPKHTDLSNVLLKHGRNHPSIELMKLRLDEVELISSSERNRQIFYRQISPNESLMLLLQTITFSKNRYNELTIVYRSYMTKQRCETKISLSTNLKDRVSLNYLYCIAEPRYEDMLAFEVAYERVEVRLKEILKKTNVIIVGKTNSRKIAEIAYYFVQSQKNDGRQRIGDMNNIAQIKNKENDIDSLNSHRKTIYIKVCPQRPSKVTLQGKYCRQITSKKVIYESASNPIPPIYIILNKLQDESHSEEILHIVSNQLYSEQYYVLTGAGVVKVVTACGGLTDVLQILRLVHEKYQMIEGRGEGRTEEDYSILDRTSKDSYDKYYLFRNLIHILTILDGCEDEECDLIISQLLYRDSLATTTTRISKLAQIAYLDLYELKYVISRLFKGRFAYFYSCFEEYHLWNHRYLLAQRRLFKATKDNHISPYLIKMLKKAQNNPKTMFGLTSITFCNYLISTQLPTDIIHYHTSQSNNSILRDPQSTVCYILHIFERYSGGKMKLYYLQYYLIYKRNVNINHYIMRRILNGLIYEEEYLRSSSSLLKIVSGRQRYDIDNHDCLTKMLLEEDRIEDTGESEESFRKNTLPSVVENEEEEHLCSEKEKHYYQSRKKTIHNEGRYLGLYLVEIDPQPRQYFLTVVLCRIHLVFPDQILSYVITAYNSKSGYPILSKQTKSFPYAVTLATNEVYMITCKTASRYLYGVFLVNRSLRSIKLYDGSKEVGQISLCQESHEDSYIVVEISKKTVVEIINNYSPYKEGIIGLTVSHEYYSFIKPNIQPKIDSPYIKLQFLSIYPSKSLYCIDLHYHPDKILHINYPKITDYIIPNTYTMSLHFTDPNNSKLLYIIYLDNVVQIGIRYAVCDCENKQVYFVVTVQLSCCWSMDTYLYNTMKEYLSQIVTIYTLLSLTPIYRGKYDIMVETSYAVNCVDNFVVEESTRMIHVMKSIRNTKRYYGSVIKVVKANSRKEVLCEFKFEIRQEPSLSITRSYRCLVALYFNYSDQLCINSFRMLIDVSEINIRCESNTKLNRIFDIFMINNMSNIRKWISGQYNESSCEELFNSLVSYLRSYHHLTFSYIEVLFQLVTGYFDNEVIGCSEKYRYLKFVGLISSSNYSQLWAHSRLSVDSTIYSLSQYYNVFDVANSGMLPKTRADIIRRLIQKYDKHLYKLPWTSNTYNVQSSQQGTTIIDLNTPKTHYEQIDYLLLLYRCIPYLSDGYFSTQNVASTIHIDYKHFKPNIGKQGYLVSVKLISFERLSLNNAPATLLFKINGKCLNEPIPRCYSNKFSYPYPEVQVEGRSLQLEIYAKKLDYNGRWQYYLVERVELKYQIAVLQGRINFYIDKVVQKDKSAKYAWIEPTFRQQRAISMPTDNHLPLVSKCLPSMNIKNDLDSLTNHKILPLVDNKYRFPSTKPPRNSWKYKLETLKNSKNISYLYNSRRIYSLNITHNDLTNKFSNIYSSSDYYYQPNSP